MVNPNRSAKNVAILPNENPIAYAAPPRSRGVRAHLHGRGAEGIRRLQPMATLNASAAPATPADMDIKAPDQRPYRRQVLLILGRHVRVSTAPPQSGARTWHGHVVRLVDHRRNTPPPLSPEGSRFRPGRRGCGLGRLSRTARLAGSPPRLANTSRETSDRRSPELAAGTRARRGSYLGAAAASRRVPRRGPCYNRESATRSRSTTVDDDCLRPVQSTITLP